MNIIVWPREDYNNNRVHLNVFLRKELSQLVDNIFWIYKSKKKNTSIELKEGNNVFSISSISESNGSKHNKFMSFILFLKNYNEFKKILSSEKIDVVYVRSGYLESMAALFLRSRYKYIFCYHLSTVFFLVDSVNYKLNPNLRSFIRQKFAALSNFISKSIIKKSDIFLPVSKKMGDYYNRDFNLDVFNSPLCCDSEFINYESTKPKIPESLVYVGQLSTYRDSMFLLRTLDIIVNGKNRNVKLNLVGEIMDQQLENEISDFIRERQLSENIVIQKRRYEKIPEYVSSFTIGLAPRKPYPADIFSSPTKVMEYLSLGIPTIANYEIPDQSYLIRNSLGGILVPYDEESFASAIIKLLDNRILSKKMGVAGRKWISKNRNYSNLSKEFHKKLLSKLRNKESYEK